LEFIKLIKNINSTPDNIAFYKSHHFCDYIELIALLNNTNIVSKSDIYERFYDDNKIERKGDESSETNDNWETRISNWFMILNIRKELFKEFYPFDIDIKNNIILKSNTTNNHKLYIFLLLNSNQRYISKDKNLLTSDFEEVSLIALKNYLTNSALSYRFGKSMLGSDRYEGKLSKKIDLFAKDLKYKTKYDEDDLDESNNGDGGLDLVSWIPFQNDENQNNMQVVLSQCATGKEWFKKQYETDKVTSNLIDFKTKVNSAIFIPYDGRRLDRKFTEQKEILSDIWLFDRIRILNLLDKDKGNILELESFEKIVNKVIEYEEDIV